MAENTKIEWATHTFNPWTGCAKISPACDNCYAEGWAKRSGHVQWGSGQPRRRTSAKNWNLPRKWNLQAQIAQDAWARFKAEHPGLTDAELVAQGFIKPERHRVFCASLADVFDNEVPMMWRADLFWLIHETPNLDWLLLTKRVGNAQRMIGEALTILSEAGVPMDCWPWPNVWLGATVVNQEEADRDIPKLLAVPAEKRFLSIEPMLGPIDLSHWFSANDLHQIDGGPKLDWCIVGGESGPGARPMHPDWARSIRDQCAAAGVPFLFKQWGEWLPGQNDPHPDSEGQRVAHHQDGSWGATNTKINASNYVVWGESGILHRGSLREAPPALRVQAWAERVGKKAAGRQIDGRTWDAAPS